MLTFLDAFTTNVWHFFILSNQKQIPYSNVTLSSNLGLFHQLAGQPKVASTTYSLLLLVLHLCTTLRRPKAVCQKLTKSPEIFKEEEERHRANSLRGQNCLLDGCWIKYRELLPRLKLNFCANQHQTAKEWNRWAISVFEFLHYFKYTILKDITELELK